MRGKSALALYATLCSVSTTLYASENTTCTMNSNVVQCADGKTYVVMKAIDDVASADNVASKALYAVAARYGMEFKNNVSQYREIDGVDVDFSYIIQGFIDGLNDSSQLNDQQMKNAIDAFAQQLHQKVGSEIAIQASKNKSTGGDSAQKNSKSNNAAQADNTLYTAAFSCEINGQHTNIMSCFENTDLSLTINNQTTVYKQWQLTSLGQQNDDGLYVRLPEHFKLRAQNSNQSLVLSVKLLDKSGKLVQQEQAGQYRVINIVR